MQPFVAGIWRFVVREPPGAGESSRAVRRGNKPMAIALKPDDLLTTLELAVKVARSKEPLPSLWTKRTQDLGDLGVVAYVAALGGALIARATDERVDSYCQDADAGPRGYSLRKVAEFLVEHNHGRKKLGAVSFTPLNPPPPAIV